MTTRAILLKGGRLVDPSQKIDEIGDVLVTDVFTAHRTDGAAVDPPACAHLESALRAVLEPEAGTTSRAR